MHRILNITEISKYLQGEKKTQEKLPWKLKIFENFDNDLLPQKPVRNENYFLVDKDILFETFEK